MAEYFDTHCHIHEADSMDGSDLVVSKWHKAGFDSSQTLIDDAVNSDVGTMICVGCTLEDSKTAVALAQKSKHCLASIGIHPHEAKDHQSTHVQQEFTELASSEGVVAIGECGLDYFYEHSPKKTQWGVLEFQLDVALQNNLPVIFHVREAFDDFWPIFDNFKGLRGVLHSFTDSKLVLEQALNRGLCIGLNGIMTFTKDEKQLEMAKAVPLQHLVLETDAPFLTPTPYRGTICQPKHVVLTAEFLSDLRDESLEELAAATTHNAKELFGIK